MDLSLFLPALDCGIAKFVGVIIREYVALMPVVVLTGRGSVNRVREAKFLLFNMTVDCLPVTENFLVYIFTF